MRYLGHLIILVCILGDVGGVCAKSLRFDQIWAYLYRGEERVLTGLEPVTDLCYFSAQVNDTGRLDTAITRPVLSVLAGRKVKLHIVISAPANRALMYFCLARDRQTRDGLIDDIVTLSKGFDGVQIDLEYVRPEDGQAFLTFLTLLKLKLPSGKVLSVTVPARTRQRDDAYDYRSISQIADKVLVMAYDQHWQGGPPGPIASLEWCRQVCEYAIKQISPEKLIIGLPLYGRAWQMAQVARALRFEQTMELLRLLNKSPARAEDKTPFFEYLEPVRVKVYYEDQQSLLAKLEYYHKAGVKAVGFWRLGQGPPTLWQHIEALP